jgi:hypothetical protein
VSGPLVLVLGSEFPNCEPEDVLAVCQSAADCFRPAIEESAVEPIRLYHGDSPPRALFARGEDGRAAIRLTAADRVWARFAYQFSHELAHVLMNLGRTPPRRHEVSLFEESLCECASMFALRAMATRWVTQPPYYNWRDYAPQLHWFYAANVGTRPHDVIAQRWLPIFEAAPECWRAIRYVNAWPEPVGLFGFFEAWFAAAPERHHQTVAVLAHEAMQP